MIVCGGDGGGGDSVQNSEQQRLFKSENVNTDGPNRVIRKTIYEPRYPKSTRKAPEKHPKAA